MHYQWDFLFLLRYAPLFWHGVLVTLAYTAGSIFIGLVPDVASQISKAAPWAIYGACLIACVYLMPSGIHGLIHLIANRCRVLTTPRQTSDTAAP